VYDDLVGRDQWIFGYGSLVWRPAFEHRERRAGYIRGFARRFWQASPDHRGTPEAPGRVVTLVREPDARCWGMAYRIDAAAAPAILAALDYREKAGYERVVADVRGAADEVLGRALVYIAGPDNPNYLGPTPLEDIAEVAREREGPSGSNREYVLRLHEALCAIGAPDPHVSALARLLERAKVA
jgi:glutathione-specific gamma-glutamylcyclotransferase